MKVLGPLLASILRWAGTITVDNTSSGNIADFKVSGVSKATIDSTGKFATGGVNVKLDSMATGKLLGRGTAATGIIEEITLGTNLSLTGTTLNASGSGSGTTYDVITLPAPLLEDNPTNPSAALETFLNTCSNKKVIFPRGKTFLLERQLCIWGVSNLYVDFNDCTFKLPNGSSWSNRLVHGINLDKVLVSVYDASNVVFRNYHVDANKANNATISDWWNGLMIFNIDGFASFNAELKNASYHNLILGGGWDGAYKNVSFNGIKLKNHGGCTGGTSEVYIYSRYAEECPTFDNVIIEADAFDVIRENQAFYIEGDCIIRNIRSKNNRCPIDVRRGYVVVDGLYIDTCEHAFTTQSTNSGSTEWANLRISNVFATNVKGKSTLKSGVYIVACTSLIATNIVINMDGTSANANYGLYFREGFNAGHPTTNVQFENVELINPTTQGIYYTGMVSISRVKNLKITGYSTACQGFRVETNVTAIQEIDGFILNNCSTTRVYNTSGNEFIRFLNNIVLPPLTLTSSGYKGDIAYDGKYQYYCYSRNVWMKFATSVDAIDYANSYFVSKIGNDSTGDGSISAPWLTINAALAKAAVVGGKTLYVREGSYNEQVFFTRDGSLGNFITLSGYPGETAVIDGNSPTSITIASGKALVDLNDRDYCIVTNLTVQNSHRTGIGSPYCTTGASNLIVRNCIVKYCGNSAINISYCKKALIDNNIIDYPNYVPIQIIASDEAISLGLTTDFIVSNNIITNLGKEGIDAKDASCHGKIFNNTITGGPLMGIYVDSVASHSNDIEIYSNIIKDCHSGLQLACEYGGDIYDIRIHDNDFIHCHQEGIALSNYYTSNPMDNIKIYNNRMWNLYQGHSNASGIYLANNEATNVEIKNNVINGTVDVCPIRKGTAYLPNNYNISGNTFHQIVANQPTGSPYYILDDGLTYTLNLPYYNSSYEILTNKRINPRVNEYATNSATITPNTDTDDEVSVYGAQQNLTIAAPTGTPVKGQKLILRFVDNSAPRTLTWNAIYKPIGAILPTTTVSSKHLYVGFIYDVIANKWDCVAVAQEV